MEKDNSGLHISKNNPFKVRDGYFEEMEDAVHARIRGGSNGVVTLADRLKPVLFMSLSFLFILAAGAGFMKLVTPEHTESGFAGEGDYFLSGLIMPGAMDFVIYGEDELYLENEGDTIVYDENEMLEYMSESISMVSADNIMRPEN